MVWDLCEVMGQKRPFLDVRVARGLSSDVAWCGRDMSRYTATTAFHGVELVCTTHKNLPLVLVYVGGASTTAVSQGLQRHSTARDVSRYT